MLVIKPKVSTYISLSLVLAILTAGLVYILRDFAYKGSFGIWFYLISCSLLTVVILMLAVKMLAGYRFITVGKGQIEVRLPLRGFQKSYLIGDILAWEEEIVKANKKEFRQVTVAFSDHQSISVSNHEHEAYKDLVDFLAKKVGKKKVKSGN